MYGWYTDTQIPVATVAKYAKKANLGMHVFSRNDSDVQIQALMESMGHLVEYGRPRNTGCSIL